MTVLLVIVALAVAFAAAVAKGILGKEIQGRIDRRIVRSVEATITSLPSALQEEWADEWRADLDQIRAMPLTAAIFARNVRRSASQLAGVPQQRRRPGLQTGITAGALRRAGYPARLLRAHPILPEALIMIAAAVAAPVGGAAARGASFGLVLAAGAGGVLFNVGAVAWASKRNPSSRARAFVDAVRALAQQGGEADRQ